MLGYDAKADTLPEEVGSYPVTIEYLEAGRQVVKTIYVTVTGDNTQVKNDKALDASNFRIALADISGLTEEKTIQLAKAKSWDTKSGELFQDIKADFSAISAEYGSYPIKFTANGLSITVSAIVIDEFELTHSRPLGSWLFRLIVSILVLFSMAGPVLVLVRSSYRAVKTSSFLANYFEDKKNE